jgi:hypothetical protein
MWKGVVMTEFSQILKEMQAMHDKKQADYGKTGDPFANVRASEDFGIEGWVGCMTRANDKMRRLQAAARGQNLKNESIEDSLLDLATYTVIALVLYRETMNCQHTSNYKTKGDGNIYCECGMRLNFTLDEFNELMAGFREVEED